MQSFGFSVFSLFRHVLSWPTRLEYDEGKQQRRIIVPYIWIYLGFSGGSVDDFLRNWILADYRSVWSGPDEAGQAFEEFCCRFRALKSWVYDDGAAIALSDLHRGALLQPPDLQGLCIRNRHLRVARAKGWTATNTTQFGQRKGKHGVVYAGLQRIEEVPSGAVVDIGSGAHIFRNGGKAPAADFAVLHAAATQAEAHLAECGQAKQGSAQVDLDVIIQERSKACDEGDLLLVYGTRDPQIDSAQLPPLTGVIGAKEWLEYFGPYVGRAHYYARDQDSSS